MKCSGCKCNHCAHNCELEVRWVTMGEVHEVCFTCDECKNFDGDHAKRNMWRPDCPNYLEPQKFAEHCAYMRRSKLRLLPKEPGEAVKYHFPQKRKQKREC